MVDTFAWFGQNTQVVNTEYVTYSSLIILLVGVAAVGVPILLGIYRRFEKATQERVGGFQQAAKERQELKLELALIRQALTYTKAAEHSMTPEEFEAEIRKKVAQEQEVKQNKE